MRELELASKALTNILSNDVTFKKALKDVFPFNSKDKDFSSIVASLIGCELRHHLLFLELAKKFPPELTNEEKNLVLIGLGNYYFLHRLNNDQVEAYIRDILKEKYSPEIEKLFHASGSASESLEIERTSLDFISIRFNTPRWLIKMWSKHYGRSVSFKTLKANNTPEKNYVRLNPLMNKAASLNNADLFSESEVKDVYLYKGKGMPRNLPEFKNGSIFSLKPIYKSLFDKYLDPLCEETTIYSYDDDSLVRELYVRSNKTKGINLVVPDVNQRVELMRMLRVEQIKNINMFSADNLVSYQTGISHKQEFVLVNPISSSFDKIRKYPDYLLHFKRESLDAIIQAQKEKLDDLSSFVLEGGTLIYLIDTMNKKESSEVVASFLKNHADFELIEERQCFPFEKEDSTVYYAVMKLTEKTKEKVND